MASLIPGYEFDIFISYRHKDDKYDHWVTEFVNNLEKELEATFRDELSLYYDSNPTDGLLSTHDVDESLKEKLRCLVFIPVISHTYCDPASFAWVHEFRAFVEQASSDKYGLKVTLPNGNVASRVLPVQIHKLESEETELCEKILGGSLRGIDFIYNEPGVNRPLRSKEDNPHDNLARTTYRNQINKVANAVKEIIMAMEHLNTSSQIPVKEGFDYQKKHTGKTTGKRWKLAITLSGLIILAILSFYLSRLYETRNFPERSLAVLPFRNLSSDRNNDYFGEGMMQEILDNLYMIDSLEIPEVRSSLMYKNSHLSVSKIARKLNVSYLLDGDFRISPDKVSITIRLRNTKNDKIIWTEKYDRQMDVQDYIDIQSDVAQQAAKKIQVGLEWSVLDRISKLPTNNTEAYNLYLQARSIISSHGSSEYYRSRDLLEEAVSLDTTFALAYSELAIYWIFSGGHAGAYTREQVLQQTEPMVKKALRLDNNLPMAHVANAFIRLFYYQDFATVENEFKIVKKLRPSDTETLTWFTDYLLSCGRFDEAIQIEENAFSYNQDIVDRWITLALAYSYNSKDHKALKIIRKAWKKFPGDYFLLLNTIRIMNYSGKYKESIELYNKKFDRHQAQYNIPFFMGLLGVASIMTGDNEAAEKYLNELLNSSAKSPLGSPSFFAAAVYTAMNNKDKAFQMLEKACDNNEVEIYWLKVEPLFKSLHGDSRFDNFLTRIGFSNGDQ